MTEILDGCNERAEALARDLDRLIDRAEKAEARVELANRDVLGAVATEDAYEYLARRARRPQGQEATP